MHPLDRGTPHAAGRPGAGGDARPERIETAAAAGADARPEGIEIDRRRLSVAALESAGPPSALAESQDADAR
ncbi:MULTISPECIES: hypothetical protein [Microbacterium]|uniref:hypothetical protein n=1 Tax=Microbacterium TaxID=33882 RepID=UPI002784F6C6|nr:MULTISPECIES: hypothetical protein [Microbacterium]MDQ1082250.1 hypothetical protein [Microbacterium sp. SORGH_AS_0344]MDQ1168979.1 hypothetical protein [Microbacterium proteolyticum]